MSKGWTAVVLMFVAAALTIACDERRSYVFADLAEAVDHGSVERGWIPAGLPADSRDIWLAYDLDTNVTLIRFASELWEEGAVANGIVVEPIERRQVRFTGIRAIDWWPDGFPESDDGSFFRFPDHASASEPFGVRYIHGATRGDTVYLWRAAGG